MEYGGVTAFGVPTELPIYVDAAVMKQAEVVMGGGNRSSKVLVDAAELTKLPNVRVVDGLAKPVVA
jgi:prolyl-tRNA editing enzyme YbaK/EbsC (Cys-tRNA(Pro) deacylase)